MSETVHICAVCGFEYDESGTTDFHELPEQWRCPECGIEKFMFHHYACPDIVAEMTGKNFAFQLFTTVELPHTPDG